jgi:hypothetical protein
MPLNQQDEGHFRQPSESVRRNISGPWTGAEPGVESAEYRGVEPRFFVAYARQVGELAALDTMMRAPPLSRAASCRLVRCAARARRHALPQACARW